eukprot:12962259-Alexandrium_andersonii.AAC.1
MYYRKGRREIRWWDCEAWEGRGCEKTQESRRLQALILNQARQISSDIGCGKLESANLQRTQPP